MDKSLTVVTSIYNKGDRTRASIQSILDQTYQDFEYIIVNDGSTDNTKDILEEFDDPRLRIIHQSNTGFVNTMVSIMDQIQTPYVAIQGAGDISFPTRFEAQIRHLESDASIGAVSSYTTSTFDSQANLELIVRKHSQASNKYKEVLCTSVDQMINKNFVGHGEIVMRTSAYVEAGGYRPFFHYCQDFDLWLRILEKYSILKVNQVLYLKVSNAQTDIYGNPRKAERQALYFLFAKNLARERILGNTDSLERYGERAFNEFVGTLNDLEKYEVAEKVAMNSINSQFGADEAIEIIQKYSPNHPSIKSLILLKIAKNNLPYGGVIYQKYNHLKNRIVRLPSKLFPSIFTVPN